MKYSNNIERYTRTSDQQTGIDYAFLIIILLYLSVFLGTLQCSATQANSPSENSPAEITRHILLYDLRNRDEAWTVLA